MSAIKKTKRSFKVSIQIDGKKFLSKTFYQLPLVFGRGSKADVVIPLKYVSEMHFALVETKSGQMQIVDLGSSNGTFINGRKIQTVPFQDHARMTLGNMVLTIENLDSMELAERSSGTLELAGSSLEEKKLAQKTRVISDASSSSPVESLSQVPCISARNRVLEGVVSWRDEIYDIHQFDLGEKISVGRSERVALSLPALARDMNIAAFGRKGTKCLVPWGSTIQVKRENQVLDMSELRESNVLQKHQDGYLYQMGDGDFVTLDIDGIHKIHLRYAPKSRKLSHRSVIDIEEEFRRTTFLSGLVHFLIVFVGLMNATPDKKMDQKLAEVSRSIIVQREKTKSRPIENYRTRDESTKREKPRLPGKKERAKTDGTKTDSTQANKIKTNRQNVNVKPDLARQKQRETLKSERQKSSGSVIQGAKQNVQNLTQIGILGALGDLKSTTRQVSVGSDIKIQKREHSQVSISENLFRGKTPSGKSGVTELGVAKIGGLVGKSDRWSNGHYSAVGLRGEAGHRTVGGKIVGDPHLVSSAKNEGLSQKQVFEVVKKHASEIQSCYEKALLSNSQLSGRVEFEWEILSSGKVSWAQVKRTEVSGGDPLTACVLEVFKSMKFPASAAGLTTRPTIGFPFGRL